MDSHRLEKMERLKEAGISPYINYFKGNKDLSEIAAAHKDDSSETLQKNKPEYIAAGRIMSMRTFGKATFITVKDRTDELQLYIKQDMLKKDEFDVFKLCDVGDFVGAGGFLFRTKTGELTMCATSFTILTKTLRDLPEKWHGLKDVEIRHRHRYVDLIANDSVKKTFIKRSLIVHLLREYFVSKGFMEVETPMMQPIAGGAAAKPFVTHHNALDMALCLRIAPELYLKRLVVGGLERVFEINRNFRNEGLSVRHNPEFTMIEWYMAYADFHDLMNMIEEFFIEIAIKVNGKPVGYCEGPSGLSEIDLSAPWPRLTMEEAIEKYAGIPVQEMVTKEQVINILKKNCHQKLTTDNNTQMVASWGKGRLVMELFEQLVEHKLFNPTFIINYPKDVSPLAKSSKADPEITERFELFVGGIELANGFNELNDPIDQRERFEKQVIARESGDEEAHFMDNDYITALEYGMPPTAGAGMGVDRLVMTLCGQRNIREVILFPHMRPEEDTE
jgi:lysyl-tRNA synthetase class 2